MRSVQPEPVEVGRPDLLEPLEGVDEIWPCESCGKDNFATGVRRCSHCRAASPRTWTEDPTYCCPAHEAFADFLREIGGVQAATERMRDEAERQLRELDAQCAKVAPLDESEVTP